MNAPHGSPDNARTDQNGTDQNRADRDREAQDREAEDARLTEWCTRLADALGTHGLTVDLKAVLGLAGRAAHTVMRPAAPLTTFVVGYAAGLAAGAGEDSDAAVERAIAVATRLCQSEQGQSEQSDSPSL